MSDYPTFDRCPDCGEMLWTNADTDGVWCRECPYSEVQSDLFESTDTDQ